MLGIKEDCGCISEDIEKSYEYWSIDQKDEYRNKIDATVKDIILYHFRLSDKYYSL